MTKKHGGLKRVHGQEKFFVFLQIARCFGIEI